MSKVLSLDLWGDLCLEQEIWGNIVYEIVRDDKKRNFEKLANYFTRKLSKAEELGLSRLSGPVLDVGCGPGVVLEWLEKKGIESFGVDSSPGVIALQKHQNRSNVILGSLKNLEELFLGFYFKGIVLLGNNLGLAGDFEQSRVFFEQCYRMLPHGGRLVGSSIDPSQTSSEINIQYQNRNRLEGKYYGQIRIHLEYQTRTSPEWDLVLFEPKDCSELLQSVGFKCVEILPDGSSYVLIAEK